ncbi:MAG: hypothetical protein OEV94_08655 [Deltaproteobacteria bacterium]|nr:hypothetical protein [Deltaproteobacteria bacterium]
MPVTETLENARRLESAGFNHAQAQTLAEVIEAGAHSAREDLATKDFVHAEIQTLRMEIQAMRGDIQRDLRQQLIWYFTLLLPLLGALAAYLKQS